jgi:hypothetical protein
MEVSLKDLRDLICAVGGKPPALPVDPEHCYIIGSNYLFQTVTHFYTGRLLRVTAQELLIEKVAWIAETGRYADAFEKNDFSEVEPVKYGPVILGRGSIISVIPWPNNLPEKQK